MFKNIVVGLLVAILVVVAWNPVIAPTARTIGRFLNGGWTAMTPPAIPTVTTPATPKGDNTEKVSEADAPAVDVKPACYGVVDGSVVPYGTKHEFAESRVNVVTGPAVVEWWDGQGGQGHEGMYYVALGETLTLPRGVRGGYWQIIASSAMTAEEGLGQLVASHAHLVAFAGKPQHNYAAAALAKALEGCDWGELEDLLVFLPEDADNLP